jgi:hypothetical protein
MNPRDILNSKQDLDANFIQRGLDVARSVPKQGVISFYIESLSKLNSVYGVLELILREMYSSEVYANEKVVMALRLVFSPPKMEVEDDSVEEEPGAAPATLFDEFGFEIDSTVIQSKIQAFAFIEKHINRNHILNEWKHFNVSLDQSTLKTFDKGFVQASLILTCESSVNHERASRQVCGTAAIRLNNVLQTQNLDGHKASYGLISFNRDVVAHINATVGYSKSNFEFGQPLVEEIQTDIKHNVSNLKKCKIMLRISELVILFKQKNNSRDESQSQNLELKFNFRVTFASSTSSTTSLNIPASSANLYRLVFDQNRLSEEYLFDINLDCLEEYLSNKESMERFVNIQRKKATDIIPDIRITLQINGADECCFEIPLAALLAKSKKAAVQDLEVFKGYVPSSKASHEMKGSLRPIARIAADVFVFNTDKIRNPQIFDDFAKILTSTLFRTEYRLKDKYASAFDEPKKGLTTMQLTKGIKEELGLPNGEIQEIVQLIGLKENSQEVDLEKVVSNPFLPEISIPANSCSLTLVEIIRVFKDSFRNLFTWTLKAKVI